jgi:RNA polymerase sigma-70 factor (ECF subfamily)
MPREAQRVGQFAPAVPPVEEATLAQRYSELYENHFEFVWRSARYLGEPDASLDDAVQDTFLVAYRRFEDFEARSSPRTWLFAITMRVVSDHRRSRRRKNRLLDGIQRMIPRAVTTPYEHAAHAEAGRSLLRALDALGEEQRATFVMADLEDMSAPEIASVLDVNLNTVYSRLRAARRAVASQMEPLRREVDGE